MPQAAQGSSDASGGLGEPRGLNVGIVVLTHGSSGEYQALVDQLIQFGIDSTRIVLVHNPVRSDEPQLEPRPSSVRVCRAERNLGYTGGMNLGIRTAMKLSPAYVLILTREVRLDEAAVRSLVTSADDHREYGILGPMLHWPALNSDLAAGGRVSRWGMTEHIRLAREDCLPGTVRTVDWIDGAVMLLRTDMVARIGLFDERLFIYFEDADLCLRAKRAGWLTGVATSGLAFQRPGASERPGAAAYLMARNGLHFARLNSGALGLGVVLARMMWSVSVHFARSRLPFVPYERATERLTESRVILRGIIDYVLGRWGPPPRYLLGLGDVSGAAMSSSS